MSQFEDHTGVYPLQVAVFSSTLKSHYFDLWSFVNYRGNMPLVKNFICPKPTKNGFGRGSLTEKDELLKWPLSKIKITDILKLPLLNTKMTILVYSNVNFGQIKVTSYQESTWLGWIPGFLSLKNEWKLNLNSSGCKAWKII